METNVPTHKKDLSIMIPTYNESKNLPGLTKRIMKSLLQLDFELIFIDDNSPDHTADLAKELKNMYGNIKILQRPYKMGLGSAVLDGMKIANGRIIAVMDADLQHPPEFLPLMFEKVGEGQNLVVASRYIDKRAIIGLSLWRRLISISAIKLAHLLLPVTRKVKDPMSGFFMFTKEVLNGVQIEPSGFKVLLQILVKGKYCSIVELPYIFRSRDKGDSKMGFREIIKYLILIQNLLRED